MDVPVIPPQPPGGPELERLRTVGPEAQHAIRRPLAIGFVVISVLVLLLLVLIYRTLVRPLLWAAVLSILVYPAHARLLRLVGNRATLAAVLSTVAAIAVLVLPSIFAVTQLLNESRDLWPRLQSQFGQDTFHRLADWAEASNLRRLVHMGLEVPDEAGAAGLENRIQVGIDSIGDFVARSVRDMTMRAPNAVLRLIITVVTFFFFLRQGPGWTVKLREALPLEPTHTEDLLQTVTRTLNAVFRGVLLTAASQSLLATIGFTAAGTPVPVLLGFLTFIASLIPFLGAFVVWGPTAVGMFLTGHVASAIGLAIWGALVVSLIDNILKPYFIGHGMRLPMLWLFLSIIGGLESFGFLGLVLGPAALALFVACYKIYIQQRRSVLVSPATPPIT